METESSVLFGMCSVYFFQREEKKNMTWFNKCEYCAIHIYEKLHDSVETEFPGGALVWLSP